MRDPEGGRGGAHQFYTMQNVFYLPETSRWSYIQQLAKQGDIALKIDSALIDTVEDIRKHDYVPTPGRDLGAAALEDDEIPFEAKMTELRQTAYAQTEESVKLDEVIRKNLEGLGYAN